MIASCPSCGCCSADGSATHTIVAAIAGDEVDRAIDAGLLTASGCPACSETCTAKLLATRDARRGALAARERFRARNERLQRRADELMARRAPAQPAESDASGPRQAEAPSSPTPAPAATPQALPAGAAAALTRAKARAAGRQQP